ncbi:MAG: hypothetical protein RPR40_06175 [Bermanella sp.]
MSQKPSKNWPANSTIKKPTTDADLQAIILKYVPEFAGLFIAGSSTMWPHGLAAASP